MAIRQKSMTEKEMTRMCRVIRIVEELPKGLSFEQIKTIVKRYQSVPFNDNVRSKLKSDAREMMKESENAEEKKRR